MKRNYRVFYTLVLLLISVSVYGQISLGAFSGLNAGKLMGDGPKDGYFVSNPGFNAGAFIDVSLSKSISLSLQPSFSQEGTKIAYYKDNYVEPIDSIQLRLNYFSLPLLLKVQSSSKHFYAIGGFEAAYLLAHNVYSNGEELDDDLNINSFNIAAHFGAGYRIFIGYPVLFIELRYSQGLLNITNEPINKSYIPRVKTTGFKFIVGIELPLSKSQNN